MVFNMKKNTFLIIAFGIFALTNTMLGQDKKPLIMILPSDNFCIQRNFLTEIDNNGTKQKVPNYKQAFQEDSLTGQVISKINFLLFEKGFLGVDAERVLKNIEADTARNSDWSTLLNPLNKLLAKGHADIIIQIGWKVNKTDQGISITYVLEAFDPSTSKRIASSTGTSSSNNTVSIPVLIQNAIMPNIDSFTAQIQSHFDDMVINGRIINLTIKKSNIWDKNLAAEIDGKRISEYVNDWLLKNTVKGSFKMIDASDDIIHYEQVRIPFFDETNRVVGSIQFTRGLKKLFRVEPFNIKVESMNRFVENGIEEGIIILGGN